jgi:hypothetical protein
MQIAMSSRIRNVNASSHHCNRSATSLERGAMSGGIDPARHSAYDGHTRARERTGDHSSDPESVARCVSSPDNRNNGRLEHRGVAESVELVRRVTQILEGAWILRISATPNHWVVFESGHRVAE